MKKILFLLLTFASFSAMSQIDIGVPGRSSNKEDEAKLKVAIKNAEYNGAIVGYAQACKFSSSDYQKVEFLLFKNFNAVGLSHPEINKMREIYENSRAMAKLRGQNNSPNECTLFGEQFKKIVNTIRTDN